MGVRLEMLEHMLIEERNARRAMEGMVRYITCVPIYLSYGEILLGLGRFKRCLG